MSWLSLYLSMSMPWLSSLGLLPNECRIGEPMPVWSSSIVSYNIQYKISLASNFLYPFSNNNIITILILILTLQVQVVDAAEMTRHSIPTKGGVLAVSQSGETKDVYRSIKMAQEQVRT